LANYFFGINRLLFKQPSFYAFGKDKKLFYFHQPAEKQKYRQYCQRTQRKADQRQKAACLGKVKRKQSHQKPDNRAAYKSGAQNFAERH